jgi:hypothetical protein
VQYFYGSHFKHQREGAGILMLLNESINVSEVNSTLFEVHAAVWKDGSPVARWIRREEADRTSSATGVQPASASNDDVDMRDVSDTAACAAADGEQHVWRYLRQLLVDGLTAAHRLHAEESATAPSMSLDSKRPTADPASSDCTLTSAPLNSPTLATAVAAALAVYSSPAEWRLISLPQCVALTRQSRPHTCSYHVTGVVGCMQQTYRCVTCSDIDRSGAKGEESSAAHEWDLCQVRRVEQREGLNTRCIVRQFSMSRL